MQGGRARRPRGRGVRAPHRPVLVAPGQPPIGPRTAGRWRTGCASRSRSSRRSGRRSATTSSSGSGWSDREDVEGGLTEAGRRRDRPDAGHDRARSTSSTSSRARSPPTRRSPTSSPGSGRRWGPRSSSPGRFRERVNLPIFHAARIADVATARYAIAEGLVDMVGMMRAHMADPHIVRKLEAGEADRIRPCVGASYCINRLYLGLEALCIHNPATGREETIPQLDRPVRRAGATGRRRGRRAGRAWRRRVSPPNAGTTSSLFEAASGAGRPGPARGAGDAAAQPISSGSSTGSASECRHARGGPAVRVPSRTADEVLALAPDVVIVATGGSPRMPDLAEGDGPGRQHVGHHRRGGHPVTRRRSSCSTTTARRTALSCAERMVAAGSTVEIVTPDRHVGHEVTGTAYPRYLAAFYEHGVRLTPDHRMTRRAAGRGPAARGGPVERLHDGRRPSGSSTRSWSSTARRPTTSCTWTCRDGSSNRGRAGSRRVHRGSAAGARRQPIRHVSSCSGSAMRSPAATSMPRSTRPAGSR